MCGLAGQFLANGREKIAILINNYPKIGKSGNQAIG